MRRSRRAFRMQECSIEREDRGVPHRGRGKGGNVLSPESGFSGARLLTQCGIQSVDFPHGAVVCRVNGNDVDSIGIVFDPVQDRFSQWTVASSELLVPAVGIVLRAEDRG